MTQAKQEKVFTSDRQLAVYHRELVKEKLGADNYKTLIHELYGVSNGYENEGLFERKVYGQCVFDKHQEVYRTYPTVRSHELTDLRLGRASKETRSNCARGRLRELVLSRHFLATGKTKELDEYGYGYVWYVNSCQIVGDQARLLLKFDIDCHQGQTLSQAQESASQLAELIGLQAHEFYQEPSTNGHGVHLYVLVAWDWDAGPLRISEDILALENELAVLTSDWAAPCGEVKGKPIVYGADRSVKSYGSWAKAPRPSNVCEASKLVTVLSTPIRYAHLLATARKNSRSVLSCSRKKTTTASTSPTARIAEGGEGRGHYGIREERAFKENQTGIESAESGNTFVRASQFTPVYMRQFFNENNRLPNLEELIQAYTEAGLKTGKSDERCLADAFKIWTETFDPDKAKKKGIENTYPDALRLISSELETPNPLNDLKLDYERRKRIARAAGKSLGNVNKLKRLKLAQVLAVLIYHLQSKPDQTGTFGKEQCNTLVMLVYGRELHGNEFRAAIRWLRRNGFIQFVRKHRASMNSTGRCRTYKLTLPTDRQQAL